MVVATAQHREAALQRKPYIGMAVDLDELFQAHWIITT
jgi:hypothetical protein